MNAAAPLLQTPRRPNSDTVINSRTNVTLPLATRNYVQLTLLAPGIDKSKSQAPLKDSSGTTANGGRPYVNGNREQANNFLLDGVDNNQVSDNLRGLFAEPGCDPGIQHDHATTLRPSSETFQGGIVSVSIKSGTNEFHGACSSSSATTF